jgi:regulatory protein
MARDVARDEARDDPESVARIICLQLLTERSRTRSELAVVLRRRGVPDAAAATVLDRLGAVGLVDDAAFAEAWVHSRHIARGLGRRALAAELRRKGVADDLAGEALALVDDAAEEQRATELVQRRLRSIPAGDPQDAAARRLVGMLARKGYPAGLAYRVVRAALQERGTELAELNDAGLDAAEPAGG